MPASSVASVPDVPIAPAAPIAPRWHTALLIALIVSVAIAGAVLTHVAGGSAAAPSPAPGPSGSTRLVAVYLPMIVVQVGLLFYVARVGRPRSALAALLGPRPRTSGAIAGDLAWALGGWLSILAIELAWARLFAGGTPRSVAALLPKTVLDRAAWIVVSIVVGLSEEVVYRGYFQRQLAAFTGRGSVALALQAVLFGIAHGEQGPAAMLRIALYGLLFGAIAQQRRSLWPGIACHVWTNVASGLLRG